MQQPIISSNIVFWGWGQYKAIYGYESANAAQEKYKILAKKDVRDISTASTKKGNLM